MQTIRKIPTHLAWIQDIDLVEDFCEAQFYLRSLLADQGLLLTEPSIADFVYCLSVSWPITMYWLEYSIYPSGRIEFFYRDYYTSTVDGATVFLHELAEGYLPSKVLEWLKYNSTRLEP